ncbi:MGMT family protein [Elusimicrobiota bacterium]
MNCGLTDSAWKLCRKIPKGKVVNYGFLANALGKPGHHRAVARAMAKNPYAPKVPCHRVVCADGALGGYSAKGGIPAKRRLLLKEGVKFDSRGRICKTHYINKL